MPRKIAPLLACALMAGGALRAESSEYPIAINLPTTERMQYWDLGVIFTHRFIAPAQDHGKDAYGLDGFTYAGLGVDFGFKPIKGMNVLLYRTADNKTFSVGLQQLVLDKDRIRIALKAERFDEVVKFEKKALVMPDGTPAVLADGTTAPAWVGISGFTFQVPMDIFITDDIVLALVPTYLSRTTSQEKGIFNLGAALRIAFTDKFSFVGEYYPRPSKVSKSLEKGFAAGISYKTFKHRFSVFGTNSTGTTTHQVLGGDYGGGPRATGKWSIGFNVARVF